MREIWDIIWHRFNVILSVVGDANARVISLLFYFTILVPFGIGASLFSDPLRQKKTANDLPAESGWLERAPVPNDLDSAKRQG